MTIESDAEIALAVKNTGCDKETMKVIEGQGYPVESSKDMASSEASGERTGIVKFGNARWRKYLIEIEQLLAGEDSDAYDAKAMTRLAQKERITKIVSFQDLPFIEIDLAEDLVRV